MTEIADLRAAVVGTGFIGVVHVDALRQGSASRSLGIVGSTPERAAAKGLAPAYESYEALVDDDAIDVVHLTTPNHLHYPQAKQAARCREARRLREAARGDVGAVGGARWRWRRRSGLVHCTNFNLRFFPLVQDARARVRAGEIGAVWNVHGGYLQDWLRDPTDWNWRLEPEKAGELRRSGTSARTGWT